MRYRHLISAAVIAMVIASALIPAAAQAPAQRPAAAPAAPAASGAYKIPASTYVAPKTPWGDPDLQGVYDYQSMIPMQRPAEFAGKTHMTDAELAAWAKVRTPNQDQCGYGTKAGQDCTVRQLDNVGGYNEFWDNRKIVPDNRTSLIEDPADGRIPPMTPEGVRKAQEYRKIHPTNADEGAGGNVTVRSWDDFPGITRCIAEQTPNGVQMYNSGTYIMQSPGWVMIVRERLDTRYIPLDGRPHIGKKIQSYLGDSRGHWEGGTLVIETTNLNGRTNYSAVNITLVERLTRVEPDVLRYEAIIDDPSTYTARVRISIPFTSPAGYRVLPYDCHEGNLAVLQGLGGERAEDAALAADAGRGIVRPRRPIQGGLTVGGQPIPESGPAQN